MAKTISAKAVWALISIVLGGIVIAFPQIISLAIGIYLILTGIISLVEKK